MNHQAACTHLILRQSPLGGHRLTRSVHHQPRGIIHCARVVSDLHRGGGTIHPHEEVPARVQMQMALGQSRVRALPHLLLVLLRCLATAAVAIGIASHRPLRRVRFTARRV